MTHNTAEWEAARALGAESHCRIPGSNFYKAQLAGSSHLDPGTALMLAQEPARTVRTALALNSTVPAAALWHLVDTASHNDDVLRLVASNLITPPDLLQHLSAFIEPSVRVAVTQNPNTSPETLQQMAEDSWSTQREWVASNPNTSPATLKLLSTDHKHWVRRNVAKNPSTPVAVLERLVRDAHFEVREGVAANPNAPVAVLKKFVRTQSDRVRRAATQRLAERGIR